MTPVGRFRRWLRWARGRSEVPPPAVLAAAPAEAQTAVVEDVHVTRSQQDVRRYRRRMKAALICLALLVVFVFGAAWGGRFIPPMMQTQIDQLRSEMEERWDGDEAGPYATDPELEQQVSKLAQQYGKVVQENVDLKERVTALEEASPPEIPSDRSAEIAELAERVKTLEEQPKADPDSLVTLEAFNNRFAANDEIIKTLQTQMQAMEESNLRRDKDTEEMKKTLSALALTVGILTSSTAFASESDKSFIMDGVSYSSCTAASPYMYKTDRTIRPEYIEHCTKDEGADKSVVETEPTDYRSTELAGAYPQGQPSRKKRGGPKCPGNSKFSPEHGKCIGATFHDLALTDGQKEYLSGCQGSIEVRHVMRGNRMVQQQRCVDN